MKKNIRIQEVAKVAGVSSATVSRAMNNPSVVNEATRKTVLDAVKLTGYRVNRMARNLRTQRASTILALLPDIGNPFFSQILQGIETVLSPSGFSMLIAETKQITSCGEHLVDYFIDGRVDGMIIFDGSLDPDIINELSTLPQSRNIVCACEWFSHTSFPCVRSANRRGTKIAIHHLYELGHRKIAHVSGPKGNVLTTARRQTTIETLAQLRLNLPSEWLIEGDFTLDVGQKAARTVMQMQDRPTAIFCASDQIAYGMISEAAKHGINVPGDMAIIGFDDIELSEYFIPALTTIRQNRLGLGKRAAEILLSNIQKPFSQHDRDIKNEAVVMDVKLVKRESTAAPLSEYNIMRGTISGRS